MNSQYEDIWSFIEEFISPLICLASNDKLAIVNNYDEMSLVKLSNIDNNINIEKIIVGKDFDDFMKNAYIFIYTEIY